MTAATTELMDDDEDAYEDDELLPPALEVCQPLQNAYAEFNFTLFGSKLPDDCMITIQRKDKRCMGYFSPKRFAYVGGSDDYVTDVIAMNSEHFRTRSVIEALSTLVHEMVHCWQQHHGKPSRAGYHNKEWAAKMKEIGLQPSNTGMPGGKEVGQRMSHYIINGGKFHKRATGMIEDGLRLPWAELVPEAGRRAPTRVTYICPECSLRMMGKRNVATLGCNCAGQWRLMEEVTEATSQPAPAVLHTTHPPQGMRQLMKGELGEDAWS
jgi:hypothetical protein